MASGGSNSEAPKDGDDTDSDDSPDGDPANDNSTDRDPADDDSNDENSANDTSTDADMPDPNTQTNDEPPRPVAVSDSGQPVGYAHVPGYGVETTVGGGEQEVVTVTSLAEFAEAVTGDAPNTVIVSGTLSADSELEMLDVGSNKTIVGDGADAKLIGFGLNISGFPATALDSDTCEPEHEGLFEPISNVIIQNLTFEESPDDSINVQCYAHHIWIDHNTFYPAGDGSIDVKRGSDLVTVSWNHFIDTNKTMLLGHDEGNGEQDRGRLRATYHHNWFDNTISRTPLVRFGYAHVFNNYILTSDYFLGVGVEALSALLAERAGAASSEQPASAGSTPPGTTGVALRGTLRLGCD